MEPAPSTVRPCCDGFGLWVEMEPDPGSRLV